MHPPIHARSRGARPQALLAGLLLLVAGCASTPDEDATSVEEYNPIGPATRGDDSIGKYLGDLSTSINAWNSMTLTASSPQEQRKHSLLELNIRERVDNRFAEILTELETGPERNRMIAAAALGFASDSAALSPLIAALDDPNDKVVANALLGLGVFASPDTPVEPISDLLRYSPDPKTRWSAADCALSLVAAGAEASALVDAARAGMTDAEEPMVRSQSALILALAGDAESIDALGDLLFDEVPLVSTSAARALAYIGRQDEVHQSDAARALFAAFKTSDRDLQRRVHPSLVQLSRRDYDYEIEDWKEWVDRLP